MRLCFISNPNLTHTRRWVGWFARRGHQVCLITDTPIQRPWVEYKGVECFDLAARFHLPVAKYLVWTLQTRRILRRWQPDILHAHRATAAGWIAAFSGYHPLVVTPWGSDLYTYPSRSPLASWLARRVMTSADLVTCDSQDLRRQALALGADPETTHLIQWGVDTRLFHPQAGDHEDWRASLNLGPGPVLLSIRAVTPVYNLETILIAFQQVVTQIPPAVLVLRDYNTDPTYKQALLAQIDRLGLGASIRWAGPVEPWERVAGLYALADVALSIPRSDGTPVSVLEAMASGVPVVASDLPSLREWIADGENGRLVPPQDASALTSAILEILHTPSQASLYRQRSLEIVRDRADHDREMQKMEALYHSMLEK